MRMIDLQLWDGRRRVKGREGDQRPLGEGLSRRREIKQGGRVGMWPRQRRERERVLGKERDILMRLLAPKRNDDDDDLF